MKTAIVIILGLVFSGCTTARPWEAAQIGCLQYANAACIESMETVDPLTNKPYRAGIIICTLPGMTQHHAVTWVIDGSKTLYWDGAWRQYRTQAELGVVHTICEGPSSGGVRAFVSNQDAVK